MVTIIKLKTIFFRSDSDSAEHDLSRDKGSVKKFRGNAMKSKHGNKKSKIKSDSSSEDSLSTSEEENKKKNDDVNGVAELMELEELDKLEDFAVNDMVNDPDDFVFALADIKRKQKLKDLAINRLNNQNNKANYRLNYKRNLRILSDTLRRNEHLQLFRNSRSIQTGFLERKARELENVNNPIDRVRIAAEVASTTRNSRKCRALFSACPQSRSDIKDAVKSLREKISAGSNEVNEIKLAEAPRQPAVSGTDVKVVLHIGSPSSYLASYQVIITTYLIIWYAVQI